MYAHKCNTRGETVWFFGRFCDPDFQAQDSQNTSPRGVVKPLDCLPGYYCLSGTETAKQFPCPNGTFSNQTGLSSYKECTPCPGGQFCANPGRPRRQQADFGLGCNPKHAYLEGNPGESGFSLKAAMQVDLVDGVLDFWPAPVMKFCA